MPGNFFARPSNRKLPVSLSPKSILLRRVRALLDVIQAAAVEFARAASASPSSVSAAMVKKLVRLYSPPGVIELLTTVSLATMYHRWTSVYVPIV